MKIEAVTTDERCCICGRPARYRQYHGDGHWGMAFCGAESYDAMFAAVLREAWRIAAEVGR